MAMFLLRGSYRLLVAVCFLLGVNVFTIYVLNQTGGLSPEQCQHLRNKVHQQSDAISKLQRNISQLHLLLQTESRTTSHNTDTLSADQKRSNLTTIYMISPTYARWTQKADLTRLCQTLMHVPKLHWIVVEDSEQKTRLVTRFLARCRVESTHLNTRTAEHLRLKQNEPVWRKNRGVEQRNLALDWLRNAAAAGTLSWQQNGGGVVFFGDDDNTYDIELFEEMRTTRKVSVWPVGICGGLKFEGPTCKNGKVTGWYTAWGFERPFQIDMAGFAVNLQLLLAHPDAHIDPDAQRGYLESSLLNKLVTLEELEPKAEDCTKVLVWHTRTEVPKMKHEEQLIQKRRPSNPLIEV